MWVEVGDRLVPHFIDAMRLHNTADKYVVELEGVDNEAKAKARPSGRTACLPTSMLPQLDGNAFYLHEVNGWTVTDAQGDAIGTIRKVLDYAMYPILEVHAEARDKSPNSTSGAIEVKVDRSAQCRSGLARGIARNLLRAGCYGGRMVGRRRKPMAIAKSP